MQDRFDFSDTHKQGILINVVKKNVGEEDFFFCFICSMRQMGGYSLGLDVSYNSLKTH